MINNRTSFRDALNDRVYIHPHITVRWSTVRRRILRLPLLYLHMQEVSSSMTPVSDVHQAQWVDAIADDHDVDDQKRSGPAVLSHSVAQSVMLRQPLSLVNCFLDEAAAADFTCSVCREIVSSDVDAVETVPCGHIFCRQCLSPVPRFCPNCRHQTPEIRSASTALLRHLYNKKVKCLNADCPWKGDFGIAGHLLKHHLQHQCQHAQTAAASRAPGETFPCEHCAVSVIGSEKAFHAMTCPQAPVSCRLGCSALLRRVDEIGHALMCAAVVVPCNFRHLGCSVCLDVQRGRMAEHLREPRVLEHHLELLLKRVLELETHVDCAIERTSTNVEWI